MIVADSTLLIAGSFLGDLTEAAQKLLTEENTVVAPGIWEYEFAQYAGRKVRLGQISLELALDAFEFASSFVDVETAVSGRLAISESVRSTVSSYDAFFVHEARARGVRLVTTDEKLIRAVPDVAIGIDAYLAPTT